MNKEFINHKFENMIDYLLSWQFNFYKKKGKSYYKKIKTYFESTNNPSNLSLPKYTYRYILSKQNKLLKQYMMSYIILMTYHQKVRNSDVPKRNHLPKSLIFNWENIFQTNTRFYKTETYFYLLLEICLDHFSNCFINVHE